VPALFPPLLFLLSLDAVGLADDFIWTARDDFDLLCLWQLRNICGGGHRDLSALDLAGKVTRTHASASEGRIISPPRWPIIPAAPAEEQGAAGSMPWIRASALSSKRCRTERSPSDCLLLESCCHHR